jgi:hypothetical protein
MAVALVVDLYGVRSDEVADTLELRDYSSRDAGDGSRSGRLYAQRGRPLLSSLGAWPWCLAKAGRLPGHRYCRQEYAKALARWHFQQWLAAEAANFRTIPFAPPRTAAAAIDDATRELARDMYRKAYEMLAQIAAVYIDEDLAELTSEPHTAELEGGRWSRFGY